MSKKQEINQNSNQANESVENIQTVIKELQSQINNIADELYNNEDIKGMAIADYNQGVQLYSQHTQKKQAIPYLEKALEVDSVYFSKNILSKFQRQYCYARLSAYYLSEEQYQQALKYISLMLACEGLEESDRVEFSFDQLDCYRGLLVENTTYDIAKFQKEYEPIFNFIYQRLISLSTNFDELNGSQQDILSATLDSYHDYWVIMCNKIVKEANNKYQSYNKYKETNHHLAVKCLQQQQELLKLVLKQYSPLNSLKLLFFDIKQTDETFKYEKLTYDWGNVGKWLSACQKNLKNMPQQVEVIPGNTEQESIVIKRVSKKKSQKTKKKNNRKKRKNKNKNAKKGSNNSKESNNIIDNQDNSPSRYEQQQNQQQLALESIMAMGKGYLSSASTKIEMGSLDAASDILDMAIKYYQKSLTLAEKNNNIIDQAALHGYLTDCYLQCMDIYQKKCVKFENKIMAWTLYQEMFVDASDSAMFHGNLSIVCLRKIENQLDLRVTIIQKKNDFDIPELIKKIKANETYFKEINTEQENVRSHKIDKVGVNNWKSNPSGGKSPLAIAREKRLAIMKKIANASQKCDTLQPTKPEICQQVNNNSNSQHACHPISSINQHYHQKTQAKLGKFEQLILLVRKNKGVNFADIIDDSIDVTDLCVRLTTAAESFNNNNATKSAQYYQQGIKSAEQLIAASSKPSTKDFMFDVIAHCRAQMAHCDNMSENSSCHF